MKIKPFSNVLDGPVVGYTFRCPGCGDIHAVNVNNPASGCNWKLVGGVDKPTFSPSVLVRSGHYARHYKRGDDCWCTYYRDHPEETPVYSCYICHSFVKDGKIQFLSDCTHALAGKTVELPDIVE